MLLSATLLLLIILPLTLSLALTLSTVQSFVVRKVTTALSEKIGSRVNVGKLEMALPLKVTLHDLLVEDHGADTLIYSKLTVARLSSLSLLSDELVLSSVEAHDSELQLREVDGGILNIKEVIERITNPNGEAKFRTAINKIEFYDFDFSLERNVAAKEEPGVDLGDISLVGLNGVITDFVSHERITSLNVESFEGREKSGFQIDKGSVQLVVYEGVLDLTNFNVKSESSHIILPRLRLESDYWADYKDFNNNVSIELTTQRSRLAASDVAYFAPALWGKDFTIRSLTGVVNGTVENLEVQIENGEFGKDGRIESNLSIRGVTQVESAQFQIENLDLSCSLTEINAALIGFGAQPLAGSALRAIGALGLFNVKAKSSGSIENLSLDAQVESPRGVATYRGSVAGATTQLKVNGEIATKGLNVGALIANSSLGAVDLVANVDYNDPQLGIPSHINGQISQVQFNSNTFTGINLSGSYDGQGVEAIIDSEDENLNFDLNSYVRLSGTKHYDATLRFNNLNLHALAINKRDSISTFSGSLKINLEGNDIDNISGQVVLRNSKYSYNDRSIYSPVITATARNNDKGKYINLESEYLNMTYNSKSSYEAVYAYLKDGLNEYIPILYTNPVERKNSRKVTIANNYSTLSVDFKNFSEVANAISSGFNVADNSTASVMINPFSERFSMRLSSDFIEHNNIAATGLSLNASNDNDSLSLYATASELFLGGTSLPNYTLMGGARNNILEFSTGFRDARSSRSATVGLNVTFNGAEEYKIRLRPSTITLGESVWLITSKDANSAKGRFEISDFSMTNGSQQLLLNGVMSKEASDSLILTLKDYDIGMITSVVNNLGYSISGVSNGYVNIKQLLGSPQIIADVLLDSIDVNSIPSPPLRLSAGWDTQLNRAGVLVTNRNNRDTVVTGFYAPSTNRYLANLKVDSLNMGLIDPLLSTTISDTRGYANVDISLQGQNNKATLDGTIDAYDLKTKILYTQVEYNIPHALIEVKDNKLNTQSREMFDNDGNRALVTFNLSLDHLSNLSYDMRIVPENMLVLNTTEQDNELFYGKLYATGVATIKGDKRGVDMDITATSQPNSSFFMPLSTQSSVVKTDFITFVQERNQGQQDNPATNFRRNYIEERNKRLNPQSAAQLNITMALHVTPDLDFQLVIDPVVGDIIRARGEGRMNINIAPEQNLFEMYGDYNISEGSYLFALLNPITKRFTVESGSSIQWTGDAIDPMLNIDAVYKVKTSLDPLISSTGSSSESSSRSVPVDCIIHLGDRLSQPSVEFAIDVPSADTEQQAVIANTLIDQETISQQFLYLMFANSFIPVSSSYGSGLATSTTASTGFELLTNQLSNWLSSSNYNVVIRYRPESDLTSDEVDVGFSRGLIDNRLLIEVEGNYMADNDNYSNFMGEAYVTWLIDKAGTLKLKGFSQTIDRYDENQGLQETGVGVYYSESFDTFRELWNKIALRFRSKKNKKTDKI